ncbi:MAG TPA: pyrroloquinoline quinone biosynthesis protein PqqE [Candidatus Methylomirabilis sp.]|nr:pyrroloquinoline quinone biosynthesis protein PqqE [Candidatus Methylomirabilis sp.]
MEHRPYTLIAELTYRCPLGCPYCYNPIEYTRHGSELGTEEWLRVFEEAEALGVVQLHFTGGEPLARKDLEALVRGGRGFGLYTNLITSGVPLTRERLRGLRDAGLDNVQLSIQDVQAERSDRIAGYRAFDRKLDVARWVKSEGLPLTLNLVLHRANLDRVAEAVTLAEGLGVDRLELANTQYHGWALENRDRLLPTRAQLERAREVTAAAKARLAGQMEIAYVTPDYYSEWPKACMEGWGRRFLSITPDGLALPCHAAHTIAGLGFENVRDMPLEQIWHGSPSFNLFRGEAWMPEPCRSCPRRSIDFGGCRCQAFQLTGNAAATDPACSLSPDHHLIEAARARAAEPGERAEFIYRGPTRPVQAGKP